MNVGYLLCKIISKCFMVAAMLNYIVATYILTVKTLA